MSDFSLDISKFVEKTKLDLDTVTRKVFLDVFVRIIIRTPVDTGRARGNWQTSLGSPKTNVISRESKDSMAPSNEATSVMSGLQGDSVAFLSNGLPYILSLEYGSSRQAPAGMVRITLAEYQKFIDDAVRKL